MLIDELVSFCDEEYQNSECFPCSAKVMCERECGYNCKDCLDDIHFHHHTYRDEYNCERLLDYYIYRYSYKYCCKRQVFFHNFRQLIFHKKRQLIFHTYHVFDTHGLLRGLYCFY